MIVSAFIGALAGELASGKSGRKTLRPGWGMLIGMDDPWHLIAGGSPHRTPADEGTTFFLDLYESSVLIF